jgi:hypothetical protein
VHASLVLLNLDLALWTRLSVQLDPNGGVILCPLDSLVPLCQEVAVNGTMGSLEAFETVVITTFTYDIFLLQWRIL